MKCPKSLRYAAEPVLLLYAFGLMINAPILNQFIYKRISDEKGFPYHYSGDKSGCGTEIQNETLKMLQKEVQGLASYFQIVFSLCNAVPSIIVCLFMGAWSDSVGRKPVLILSVLGSVLECTIILVIIYYDLPLWLLFIGGVLNGLGGYFTTVTMAVLAYIADTTEEKERAVRLGLMEAIVFFGGTFSNFLSGYLITEFDFRDSYWFVFAFLTSSLLYALFVLPESLPRCKRQTAKSFCLAFPKKTWQTLARPRPHKWKLKVLIPADGFVNFLNYGTSSVVTLYLLNYPFCWASIRVGYFSGIKMLITGFGAFFVLKVFKRCLADYSMLLLGFSSNIAFYSVLALSKVSWLLYFACAASVFAGVTGPTFKGLLSKTVDPDEQGSLFSAATSLEMLFTTVGTFLFNAFYPVVNRMDAPGLVFVLSMIMAYIPVILTLVYTFKVKRDDPCINNNIVTAVQRKVDVPSAPMWMDDNANEKIINSSTGDNGSNYGSTASSSPWTT